MSNKIRKKRTLFGAILSFVLVISIIVIPIIVLLKVITCGEENYFVLLPLLIVVEMCTIIIVGLVISFCERIKEINTDEYKESKKY